MKSCRRLNIKAVLIDPDMSALAQARECASHAGLADRFECVRGTTRKLAATCAHHQPHIVEMLGLLDYLAHNSAVELIRQIRGCLHEGGSFMTCNIRHNREKMFVDWVLLWPMIYRSKQEFAELFPAAGFAAENIRIVYEPFEIHGIAVCKK